MLQEHVCRQVFYDDASAKSWTEGGRQKVEQEWPEYKTRTTLLETPGYTLKSSAEVYERHERRRPTSNNNVWKRVQEGGKWLRNYLFQHVQQIQQLKQHHVHIWDEEKKEYMVLEHCKVKGEKNVCKSHFPRTKWLIGKSVVLCKGLLQQMNMPDNGRKNLTGALHGPMNEPNLNGSHPAMLATQHCNSDVQLPYRLPLTKETHSSDLCPLGDQCLQTYNVNEVVRACQLAQDAQAGYACDYQCKRQPCGNNEVQECCVGLHKLGKDLRDKPVAYAGKRYMGRLLSHAYSNGIVRSAVENRNLRACNREHDVTFAESFKTCATEVFISP